MPSLQDIIDASEFLKIRSIAIYQDRCVVVRNRNSTCTKCMDACLKDCIDVSNNEVKIDSDACMNCGCCVCVCPSNALIAIDPNSKKVRNDLADTADPINSIGTIVCERKATKDNLDRRMFAILPCLGHVDEVLLIEAVAAGLDDIVLVDGDCPTCKLGAASEYIDEAVANASSFLEASGSNAIVTRSGRLPQEFENDRSHVSSRGDSRRNLAAQTADYMKNVASGFAKKAIDERLGLNKEQSLHNRLGVGKNGRLPIFEPEMNYRILDALEKISEDVDRYDGVEASVDLDAPMLCGEVIRTRHFGSIMIDIEKCSGCGLCVMFCPTGALSHAIYDEPEDPERKYLEFQASSCIQCLLCEDVCLRKCLRIDPEVSLEQLYDFEPELIEINKPKNKTSIFDLGNGRFSKGKGSNGN